MTRKVARLADITDGVCKYDGPQKGKIITASTNTKTNQRGIARIGDIVQAKCGHVGHIITGSGNVVTNNRKTARIGDKFQGIYSGTIITGSSDRFLG